MENDDKYTSRRFDTQNEEAIDTDVLESIPFMYPGSAGQIIYETDEFTMVCPWTGLPDFSNLMICYTPGQLLVELKSLKYYLTSYRNVGILQEHVVHHILADLVKLIEPVNMTIEADYRERGGLKTKATAEYIRSDSEG